jgi:hypothetical protein
MGVHARVQVPHLLPPVLAALADSKPNLRQAAITVINTFLKVRSSALNTYLQCCGSASLGSGSGFDLSP